MVLRIRRDRSFNTRYFVSGELFCDRFSVVRQDESILGAKKIDLRHVQFEAFLKRDLELTTSTEQLKRLSATAYFPFDARIAQTLILQKDQVGLEWLRKERKIECFSCLGTIFLTTDHKENTKEFCLWVSWKREWGKWRCEFQDMDREWFDIYPAAVL